MDLSGIISIAGYPGLYKVIAQSKNGIIVESLIDKKRMPAYSTYKISALSDISVFTTEEDLPLAEVMKKIADKEKQGPAAIDSSKASFDEVKSYLLSVLPTFDQERVHFSDMKKMISWYNLLQKNDLLKEKEGEAKAEEEEDKLKLKAALDNSTKPKAKHVESGAKAKSTGSKAKQTSTIRKTGA